MNRGITEVTLKNYRSIAACRVRLGSLTFLVGPNGSGKSNFIDSLRFTSDALTTTLDHALRDRGGINEVRRRSGGHPNNFSIRVDMLLGEGRRAVYSFEIVAMKAGAFRVKRELCTIDGQGFLASEGTPRHVGEFDQPLPIVEQDRLLLVAASSLPLFRPVYDLLTSLGFYNLNPDVIRSPQSPDPGQIVVRDGRNIAAVLGQMAGNAVDLKERIEEYLSVIVPGVKTVNRKALGPLETLEFRQEVAGQSEPWRFSALNMSDGTLRATGVLVALFQARTPLVAIEEPELALHPAAAEALYDALSEASELHQVLVTSHSPELLDNPQISDGQIRAVTAVGGETKIGSVSDEDRTALRGQLYTAGELLRLGQVVPGSDADPGQLDLFRP